MEKREETQVEQAPAIMFWNCHGLNDDKVYELQALNLIYQPNILFVIETRMPSTSSSKICGKLGFKEFRDSPATKHMEGSKGCVGLAMFWTKDVNLEFHDGSDNYLEFMVIVSNSERHRLIGFYGDPKDKNLSWELLVQLSSTSAEDRWVVGGDFNEILKHKEKSGGDRKRQQLLNAFQNALTACKLDDLLYEGNIFTREKKAIKERLDRVVARLPWKKFSPRHRVSHLTDRLTSDHIPILLETDSAKQIQKIKRSVLSFLEKLQEAIMSLERLDVTTVPRLQRKLDKMPGLYYKAVKLIAPHLIQLEDIAMRENDKVTYERLVTLRIVQNIGVLLMNSVVSPKPRPSREYKLANLPQFPYCGRDEKIPLNLSEYLAQTWLLIMFIPAADCEKPQHQIVKKIIEKQVKNLITWFEKASTRYGTGDDISTKLKEKASMISRDIFVSKKLKEKASMIGRAIYVYDIVSSLLQKERIKHEGTILELEKEVCHVCEYYYGEATIADSSREMICEPLQFLLEKFQWRHPDTSLKYRITGNSEEQFAELTEQILEVETEAAVTNNPWIKSIIKGIEKEKPENLVGTVTIQRQLQVLIKDIGCIACSENSKIALSKDDENGDSIILRLQKAGSEALEMLSRSKKPTTYEAYMRKLKEAYNRRSDQSKKKREVMGDGGKQGEKKARV